MLITCPCALGIAIPLSLVVGLGEAARDGVLVRDGDTLLDFAQVEVLFFDKTGTLTSVEAPSVEVILDPAATPVAVHAHGARTDPGELDDGADTPMHAREKRRLLAMAAALEDGTSHPLARAIRTAADSLPTDSLPPDSLGDDASMRDSGAPCSRPAADVQFDNMRTVAGAGVCGTLTSAGSVTDPGGAPGQTVAVGNRAMLDAVGASASEALHKLREEAEERGRTALYVAEGGRAVGVITLEECITEDAKLAVWALRDAGLQMSVITGDRPAAAQRLHDELGIPVHASVSPEEKVQHVRDAQRSHGAVALVGDGINDAAAIAEADVGIARTSGAGVSIEAADVALYNPNLEILSDLHALARRTRRIIHQNLGWTFGYNAIGLGLAVAGLLHPIAAVIVMATSSAFVTWNAFRIRAGGSTP